MLEQATIIVDVLTWTVLWPMLSRNPDPVAVAYFREQFLCWTSYNTHILNAVFMFGELFLNDIPFTPYLMGAVGFYSSAYALWAFSFYKATNRWIYPVSISAKRFVSGVLPFHQSCCFPCSLMLNCAVQLASQIND